MDEHTITSEGRDYRLAGESIDDNLNSMDWSGETSWICQKRGSGCLDV